VTTSAGIRFVTFVTVGIVTGYVAQRNRTLMAELEVWPNGMHSPVCRTRAPSNAS
jgi:hypothetical protein